MNQSNTILPVVIAVALLVVFIICNSTGYTQDDLLKMYMGESYAQVPDCTSTEVTEIAAELILTPALAYEESYYDWLTWCAIPNFGGRGRKKTIERSCHADKKNIAGAIEMYLFDNEAKGQQIHELLSLSSVRCGRKRLFMIGDNSMSIFIEEDYFRSEKKCRNNYFYLAGKIVICPEHGPIQVGYSRQKLIDKFRFKSNLNYVLVITILLIFVLYRIWNFQNSMPKILIGLLVFGSTILYPLLSLLLWLMCLETYYRLSDRN